MGFNDPTFFIIHSNREKDKMNIGILYKEHPPLPAHVVGPEITISGIQESTWRAKANISLFDHFIVNVGEEKDTMVIRFRNAECMKRFLSYRCIQSNPESLHARISKYIKTKTDLLTPCNNTTLI